MRILAVAALLVACHGNAAPPQPASGEGEAAPYVQTARDALVGHRAPPMMLEMLDGSHVDLAPLLGHKPIYLKFWATWCVPCREQMPHLEATLQAHGDALAVYAIDVGIDDPIENVREFVARQHLTVPVAIDRTGTIAEQLHLNVTPQHVLIDRDGIVRYVGHAVTPELEQAITAIVAPASGPAATAPPLALPQATPPLALDDHSTLDANALPHAPIALTFATLFCDSYIADSRPQIGATCAAHARQVEAMHRAHPGLRWVTVAYPVWTSDDEISDYRKRLGATLPIGIDRGNAWFHHFDVGDTYTTIVLAADGTELGRATGDGAALPALVAKL
ncbi:MAG TPA: TlpA disulfide reductase family protein [Kofleriaceae bacterium]|jgi:thiol-disulfide isomerase/thioredoxin